MFSDESNEKKKLIEKILMLPLKDQYWGNNMKKILLTRKPSLQFQLIKDGWVKNFLWQFDFLYS